MEVKAEIKKTNESINGKLIPIVSAILNVCKKNVGI